MIRDSRFSNVMHLLIHMVDAKEPMTSELLAKALQTNPVVVRRILAGLREAGLVTSEKGHGGGWRVAKPAADITLLDIHEALGEPALVTFGNRTESPGCVVEQAVNAAIEETAHAAEELMLERFRRVNLAALAKDAIRRQKKGNHHV